MPIPELEARRKAKERGIAVYLTAIFLIVLIPIVGLSIDGGYAFVIQSRLQAAVDGAALAAGRGLNFSGGVSAAETNGANQATAFFNADFPSGYMNTFTSNRNISTSVSVNTNANNEPTGELTVIVNASILAPTYFMQFFGMPGSPGKAAFPSITIAANAQSTRKVLVMELVLDKSSSMLQGAAMRDTTGVPASTSTSYTSCDNMVAAAAQFTTYFSPYDTIGMLSFNLSVSDDNDSGNDGSYTASTNYWESGSAGIQNAIGNISCGSNTNTTAALNQAYQDLKTVSEPLAQNVIVLFTDGVPNGVDADFPIRNNVDSRMSDALGGGGGCQDTSGTTYCTNGVANAVACPGSTGCVSGSASSGGSGSGGMAVCSTTTGTIKAAIGQGAGFSVSGGNRGAANILSSDSNPTIPTTCATFFAPTNNNFPSSNNDSTAFSSQTIAYIPNTDHFGNSMINIQTGQSSPTTATSPWFQWLYQVNSQCAPSSVTISSGNTQCKNLGDYWTNYPTTGQGADNNTFTGGPYKGYLRPDLPNSIGTASMTAATNQAYTIRSDTTYNPIIDVVYLQGNGGDPIDRAFLQLVSNQQFIQPLIYQGTPGCNSSASAGALFNAMSSSSCLSSGTFTNPYYVSTQQQGLWLQTANSADLTSMFQAIASSLLRLSQ